MAVLHVDDVAHRGVLLVVFVLQKHDGRVRELNFNRHGRVIVVFRRLHEGLLVGAVEGFPGG